MRLHKDHGVNPTCLVCPVCGADAGLALLGASCKGEAPRSSRNTEPCKDCRDRFDEYRSRDQNNFILYIVDDLYSEHSMDREPPPWWLYFKAAYFTTVSDLSKGTKDMDFSKGSAICLNSTAKALGLDLSKGPK